MEMHEKTYQGFDIAGAFYSPRFLVKALARKAAKNRARAMMIAALDEAVQGGFTIVGQAAPGEKITASQLFRSAGLGAAIGSTSALVLGK